MTQTRIIDNRIRWSQDQASVQSTIQSNQSVAASFSSVADAAEKLGLSAEQVKQLNLQMGGLAESAKASAAATTGLLSQQSANAAASVGFMRDLEAIQAQEAATLGVVDGATKTLTDDTENLVAATDAAAKSTSGLTARLAEAAASRALVQASAVDPVGGLRADAFGGGGGESGSGVVSALSSARMAAIALPGVGFQSPVVLGLRGLELAADKTKASVGQLAAGVLIAGAAMLALKLAMDEFNRTLAAGKARVDGALAAQENYYNALSTLTSDQVRAQIEQFQKARSGIEQQIAETQNAIDSTLAQAAKDPTIGTSGVLLFRSQLVGNLDDRLAELQKRLGENVDTTQRYSDGLNSGAFAANDAAEAAKKLADAQAKANQASLDLTVSINQMTAAQRQERMDTLSAQIDALTARDSDKALEQAMALQEEYDRLAETTHTYADALEEVRLANQKQIDLANLNVQAQSMTAAQRADEINSMKASVSALQDYIAENDLSSAVVSELTTQINGLEASMTELSDINHTYADDLENEKRLKDALKDSSDAINDGLKELSSLQLKYEDAVGKSAAALAARTDAQTENAAKQLEIEANYGDAETKARSKLNEKLIDIDAKSAERLLQQRENDNLSIERAVARGDIAAAQDILAQQKVRVEQENRNVQTQKDDARKAQDEQLTQAREAADKALAQQVERYDKEQKQRQKAYDEALQEEQAALNAVNAQRSVNAFQAQYWAQVVTDAQKKVINYNQVYSNSLFQLGQTVGNVAAGIGSAVQSIGSYLNTLRQQTSGVTGGSNFASSAGSTLGSLVSGARNVLINATQQGYNYAAGIYPSSFTGSPFRAPNGAPYQQAPLPPGFDDGGISTRPGLYYAGVPELHVPLTDKRAMGAMGNTLIFPITVTGDANEDRVRRMVREEVLPRIENAKVEVVQGLAEKHRSLKRV